MRRRDIEEYICRFIFLPSNVKTITPLHMVDNHISFLIYERSMSLDIAEVEFKDILWPPRRRRLAHFGSQSSAARFTVDIIEVNKNTALSRIVRRIRVIDAGRTGHDSVSRSRLL